MGYEQVETSAERLKIKIQPVDAHDTATLARAYTEIGALKPQALILLADVIFDARQLPRLHFGRYPNYLSTGHRRAAALFARRVRIHANHDRLSKVRIEGRDRAVAHPKVE